jgi:hypothetical protein
MPLGYIILPSGNGGRCAETNEAQTYVLSLRYRRVRHRTFLVLGFHGECRSRVIHACYDFMIVCTCTITGGGLWTVCTIISFHRVPQLLQQPPHLLWHYRCTQKTSSISININPIRNQGKRMACLAQSDNTVWLGRSSLLTFS